MTQVPISDNGYLRVSVPLGRTGLSCSSSSYRTLKFMTASDYNMVENSEGVYQNCLEQTAPARTPSKGGLTSKLGNFVKGVAIGAMLYAGAMAQKDAEADIIEYRAIPGNTELTTPNSSLGHFSDGFKSPWDSPPGGGDPDRLRGYILDSDEETELRHKYRASTFENKTFEIILDVQGPSQSVSSSNNNIGFELQSPIDEGREYYHWTMTLNTNVASFVNSTNATKSGTWDLAATGGQDGTYDLPLYNLTNAQGQYATLDVLPSSYSVPPWQEYTLTVQSLHGYPIPPVGIHTNTYGTILTNAIETATYPDRRYLSAGWAMTGHDPAQGTTNTFTMTVTNDAVVAWQWTTQYYYGVSAAPGGSITGTESGWYDPGTVVSNNAILREDCYFWRWQGAPDGMSTNNPIVFALTNGYPNVVGRFRSKRPGGFFMQIK